MFLDWASDGPTNFHSLTELERQTGIRDPRLDRVVLNTYEDWIYRVFGRIRAQINNSYMALGFISWTELEAFCRLTQVKLCPREVDLIMKMDQVYVNEINLRLHKD